MLRISVPNEEIQSAVGGLFAVEIPVTQLERSQKFYSELFAWEFAPNALPKGTENVNALYFFTDASKSIKGALMLLDEGYQPTTAGMEGWSSYPTFIVEDVGEALKKAEALGGGVRTCVSPLLYARVSLYADLCYQQYSPRTEIRNGMGVVGHVVDPDGNIIGLWSQK